MVVHVVGEALDRGGCRPLHPTHPADEMALMVMAAGGGGDMTEMLLLDLLVGQVVRAVVVVVVLVDRLHREVLHPIAVRRGGVVVVDGVLAARPLVPDHGRLDVHALADGGLQPGGVPGAGGVPDDTAATAASVVRVDVETVELCQHGTGRAAVVMVVVGFDVGADVVAVGRGRAGALGFASVVVVAGGRRTAGGADGVGGVAAAATGWGERGAGGAAVGGVGGGGFGFFWPVFAGGAVVGIGAVAGGVLRLLLAHLSAAIFEPDLKETKHCRKTLTKPMQNSQ